TDWAGRSLKTTRTPIADYTATAGARRAAIQSNSGKQAGDPLRAVDAIIAAVDAPQAPLHLVLGRVAHDNVRGKLKDFSTELDLWRDLSLAADFPETQR
ncbi:MAG: short-chain dehydrogenase/reductase, partial [Proteobacteria bacterium]|nr:short-chain dehydrogenase/reductase [Pseudomonadota bacterium]